MINDLILKGIWFLPGDEEDSEKQLTGTLTFNSEHGADLELLGSLTDFTNSSRHDDFEFILGITSNGKRVTLYKTYEYNRFISFPGMEVCKYQPMYILIGKHFEDKATFKFKGIAAKFKNLDIWLNEYGFKDFKSDYNKNYDVTYEKPESILFGISESLMGGIDFSFTAPLNNHISKVTIEQKVEFKVESTVSLPFFDIMDGLMHFQNFLTLATFEPAYPLSISLLLDEDVRVDVNYKPGFKYNAEQKQSVRELLFGYQDIKVNFEAIIKRWYAHRDLSDPITYLLFDSFYSRGRFTENRFLNIVQALETYHRRFRKNEVLTAKEHKEMVKEIIESVPENRKEWLQERLHFSNEPSLHRRLEEMIDELSIDTVRKIISDKGQFIRDIKNSRNYYTHYDVSTEKKALKGANLYKLTEKLRIMLIALLLVESGFSQDEVNQLLNKCEWRLFNHIIDY